MIRLVVIVGLLSSSSPLLAADARALYQSAVQHYNLNEYKDALADFKEAYRLKPDPAFLFNIAQCHRQLGQFSDAAAFYRSFRRERPDTPNRAEVDRLVGEMDRAAEQQRVQQTVAEPPKTEKTTPVATLPPTATAVREPPAPRRSRTLMWSAIAVGAGGVVLVGVGAGIYSVGNSAFETLNHPHAGYTFNAADEDRANTWRPAGVALLGVGSALVVAGIALIVIDRRHEPRQMAAARLGESTM